MNYQLTLLFNIIRSTLPGVAKCNIAEITIMHVKKTPGSYHYIFIYNYEDFIMISERIFLTLEPLLRHSSLRFFPSMYQPTVISHLWFFPFFNQVTNVFLPWHVVVSTVASLLSSSPYYEHAFFIIKREC